MNGRYALTFTLGFTRDVTWREGDFELKYIFYSGNYNPDGSYHFRDTKNEPPLPPSNRRLGTFIITSRDNGHTWCGPNFIETQGMPFRAIEGSTDAPRVACRAPISVRAAQGSAVHPFRVASQRQWVRSRARVR